MGSCDLPRSFLLRLALGADGDLGTQSLAARLQVPANGFLHDALVVKAKEKHCFFVNEEIKRRRSLLKG